MWQATSEEVMPWPESIPRTKKSKRPYCKVHYLKPEEPKQIAEEPAPEPPTKDLTVSLPHNILATLDIPDIICKDIVEMAGLSTLPIVKKRNVMGMFPEWEELLKAANFVHVTKHTRRGDGGTFEVHLDWHSWMSETFTDHLCSIPRDTLRYEYTTKRSTPWYRDAKDLFGMRSKKHGRDILSPRKFFTKDVLGYGFSSESCGSRNCNGVFHTFDYQGDLTSLQHSLSVLGVHFTERVWETTPELDSEYESDEE